MNAQQLELPLRLVAKLSAPNKEADHKITISTNKPAVNLPELFPGEFEDNTFSSVLVQFSILLYIALLSH